MGLRIETYTNAASWRPGNNFGGRTLFKALGHPLAARAGRVLMERLAGRRVAVYDPLGEADHVDALHGLGSLDIATVAVQRIEDLERRPLGCVPVPVDRLTEAVGERGADVVFVAAFDAARLVDQVAHLLPAGAEVVTLDALRLPDAMLTNRRTYLDPLNFSTNFAFFRDDDAGWHTAVRSVDYWSSYGAEGPFLWLCLFGEDGAVLAEWQEPLPGADHSYAIDSRSVRARFGLGPFTGSLFMHACGINGHDVIKYALDVEGDGEDQLSCTHDANPWPADLLAGVPAPADGERVILWLQNSHPVAIPPGAVGISVMGSNRVAALDVPVPAFGTHALDIADLLPDARWPDQIEVHAGRYFVRPRYEVVTPAGRRCIAHANVERTDLRPDPRLAEMEPFLGKGHILPLPVLPLDRFSSLALPAPMATGQDDLPLRLTLYDPEGQEVAHRFLGRVPRHQARPVEIDAWLGEIGATLPGGFGHMELSYDFRDGGAGDGWLHGLARYTQRASGHRAETIFGSHVYNTAVVYKDEPQSYLNRPPGLSTRLFLRVADAPAETFCHLIYPASKPWKPRSSTTLILRSGQGQVVAETAVSIACGGSLFWKVADMFSAKALQDAGAGAQVILRDPTCRLFGFHGMARADHAFALDHMFGF